MFINKRRCWKFCEGSKLELMLMAAKRPPGSSAPVKVRGDIYLAPVCQTFSYSWGSVSGSFSARNPSFSNIFPLSLDDGNGQIVHVSIEMNVARRPAVVVPVILTPPFRIPPWKSPTPKKQLRMTNLWRWLLLSSSSLPTKLSRNKRKFVGAEVRWPLGYSAGNYPLGYN